MWVTLNIKGGLKLLFTSYHLIQNFGRYHGFNIMHNKTVLNTKLSFKYTINPVNLAIKIGVPLHKFPES